MRRRDWARRKGRSSTSWIRKSTRYAIYHRDGFDCVYCLGVFPPDFSGRDLSLDHIVPRSQGGTHRADNLVTCCRTCNSRKQDAIAQGFKGIAWPASGVSGRIARAVRRPLNREVGRILSAIYAPMQPSKRLFGPRVRA